MQSKNKIKSSYDIFEDKKAIKFMNKHFDDKDLISRIYDKYLKLSNNPYTRQKILLKVKNVQNVKKQE